MHAYRRTLLLGVVLLASVSSVRAQAVDPSGH